MDRWALLEHTVSNSSNSEVHFDFLVENGSDCLTWKILELPKPNGPFVEIKNQPNHRLVWLTTEYEKLSRERGYVRRIDFGNYIILGNNLSIDNFSLKLNGNLFIGIFSKKGNVCQLCGNI
tara:strand:- start:91 stop:453 length:363 start_codon:yes stop_codon:yes gene_type:complete